MGAGGRGARTECDWGAGIGFSSILPQNSSPGLVHKFAEIGTIWTLRLAALSPRKQCSDVF